VSRRDPRSGIVLVTVLWSIALISALAMAASTTFRGFAGIVALDRDRARADALLHAGLEIAAAAVTNLGDKKPLTERVTSITLSTGSVRLRLSDEGGRIDVNKAPVKVLAALLHSVGAGTDNANLIAKAIDAWRVQDAADQTAGGAQLPNAPPPQSPPTALAPGSPPQANASPQPDDGFRSFTDIRQLAQIPGMEPDYIAAIAPLTTVFGTEQVNALTAPGDVIAALPGINPAQVSVFLDARSKLSGAPDSLQQLLGSAKEFTTLQGRPVALVELTARLIDGYAAAARAVIVIVPHDKLPYRVLSWTPLTPSSRRALLADRF
jgi:general secretion pathway protein K